MKIMMFSLDERDGEMIEIPDGARRHGFPVWQPAIDWVDERLWLERTVGDSLRSSPNSDYTPLVEQVMRVEWWSVERYRNGGVERLVLVQPGYLDRLRRGGLIT